MIVHRDVEYGRAGERRLLLDIACPKQPAAKLLPAVVVLHGGREPSAVSLLLGGRVDEKKEQARQASPINYVTGDAPPFLLVHGTNDPTVPFEQAEAFYRALKAAGADVTLIRIEGGGHSIAGLEPRDRAYAFLEKHLRGKNVRIDATPIPAQPAPARKERSQQ
ncbi:MAG: prolyl oligopeptidase family serine peptidase [Verrucomicrobiae bacterium]|nr:prolyl oligopeptidase family serine peptidase [Verrucomicrobiae bacterium]